MRQAGSLQRGMRNEKVLETQIKGGEGLRERG